MTRIQLENIYKANGLNDYKLKTTEDLLKVHGIDFKAIKGYSELDDLNKAIFEKFILKFFNALGFDRRTVLVPKGIYRTEEPTAHLRFEYQCRTNDERELRSKWLYIINDGEEWY